MNFLTAAYTDVGIKKRTNQDSMLILRAQTNHGPVLLAVMCDGMGGLAKGEVASACMIMAFREWFKNDLPYMIENGFHPDLLREGWEGLIADVNRRISAYTALNHVDMGTTCAAFFVYEDTYYIMNIGDSRVYLISDNVYQLTKDHTLVQRELDLGHITYEESLVHPQRSVLLQCVGSSDFVAPDFISGSVVRDQCYLICCDGFRHLIGAQEFFQYLNPAVMTDPEIMRNQLYYLTELNKQRQETDNISAVLIRTC